MNAHTLTWLLNAENCLFSPHILTFAHLKILFDSFLHIGQSHYFLLFRRLWFVPVGLVLWYFDLRKWTNMSLTCAGSFSKEQVCCLRTTLLGRILLQLVSTLLFFRPLPLSLYRPESNPSWLLISWTRYCWQHVRPFCVYCICVCMNTKRKGIGVMVFSKVKFLFTLEIYFKCPFLGET